VSDTAGWLLALTEEQVLRRYRGAIERSARRLATVAPTHLEIDDLLQAGAFGLLLAFRRARASGDHGNVDRVLRTRMWGSLVDEVRRAGSTREIAHRGGPGVRPASPALAGARDMPIHTADQGGSSGLRRTRRSVERVRDERDHAVAIEIAQLWRLAQQAIARLPRAERLALVLYDLHGIPMHEVGRRLGVTQSRASQLRHDALARLRVRMRRFAP
jgi:RNA polymerase sigma factor for flagellar operon FliA